jgi:serine phosphatase RsbU (regulator of sigma subunit)
MARDAVLAAWVSAPADRAVLGVVGVGCAAAAVVWARSARRLRQAAVRIAKDLEANGGSEEPLLLARSAWRKDLHTVLFYGAAALAAFVTAGAGDTVLATPFLLVLVPVALSFSFGSRFVAAARIAERRAVLERRAEEVLAQESLAPQRWASRLAPDELPAIEGFEVGHVYRPGTGAMAGDFYDVAAVGGQRFAVVIGDVTGHGIEPSITAFQVKYLLRVFLRQYRDPGQAVEELNVVLSGQARVEELVSLCAVVFDRAAGTLRFASAGHPPAWLWHDGEVRPLRATGPLLTLDPRGEYWSREVPLDPGDTLLLYTDGLAEARCGEALFGEERIAAALRRDAEAPVATLCKDLLEAAEDFASEPLRDDVAILAIRKVGPGP